MKYLNDNDAPHIWVKLFWLFFFPLLIRDIENAEKLIIESGGRWRKTQKKHNYKIIHLLMTLWRKLMISINLVDIFPSHSIIFYFFFIIIFPLAIQLNTNLCMSYNDKNSENSVMIFSVDVKIVKTKSYFARARENKVKKSVILFCSFRQIFIVFFFVLCQCLLSANRYDYENVFLVVCSLSFLRFIYTYIIFSYLILII